MTLGVISSLTLFACSTVKPAVRKYPKTKSINFERAAREPKRVWRHEPDLTPRKDLAYLAGFYLGDGRGAGHEHKVRFNLADKAQLELVNGLTAGILGMSPKPCNFDGMFYAVDYDSVRLSDFLNQPLADLIEYLKGFERDFLQGFFDAEGYASCRVDLEGMAIRGLMVGVANTNLDYLNLVRDLLAKLGIASSMHRTNRAGQVMTLRGKSWIRRHDVYHVMVTREPQIRLFKRKVGFRNPMKADKIESLVRMIPMTPRDRFAWFTELYARRGRRWIRIRNS
jgi:intein-encoded DNA endonuclease-like protein